MCKRYCRADSRLAPSQWETSLQSNAVSHWLGANPESALYCIEQDRELLEMTSWHWHTFGITSPLWEETTLDPWSPLTQGYYCEALVFCNLDNLLDQTAVLLINWHAVTIIWRHHNADCEYNLPDIPSRACNGKYLSHKWRRWLFWITITAPTKHLANETMTYVYLIIYCVHLDYCRHSTHASVYSVIIRAINSCRAEFDCRKKINLHLPLFLDIEAARAVEILPPRCKAPVDPA